MPTKLLTCPKCQGHNISQKHPAYEEPGHKFYQCNDKKSKHSFKIKSDI